MSEVYTMKGILKGLNTDATNGLPLGCSIARIKDGKPEENARGYWLMENKITPEAVEALKELTKGEEVSYQMADYRILKIGKAGVYSNNGGKYNKPYDPVADAKRQVLIVRQSCLDRAVTLWVGIKPGDYHEFSPKDKDQILSIAQDFETWVKRE